MTCLSTTIKKACWLARYYLTNNAMRLAPTHVFLQGSFLSTSPSVIPMAFANYHRSLFSHLPAETALHQLLLFFFRQQLCNCDFYLGHLDIKCLPHSFIPNPQLPRNKSVIVTNRVTDQKTNIQMGEPTKRKKLM